MIYRWEMGRALPSLENALLLGACLAVPVEQLFKELREESLAEVRRRFTREEDGEVETDENVGDRGPIRYEAMKGGSTPAIRDEPNRIEGRTANCIRRDRI